MSKTDGADVHVRLSREMREAVEQLARDGDRSLTAQVRRLIVRGVMAARRDTSATA